MIIEYDVHCFESTLYVKMPDKYAESKDDILKLLDDAYLKWHDVENIEDPEEQAYVHDIILEEYMMECLAKRYEYIGWDTIGWSEDDIYE